MIKRNVQELQNIKNELKHLRQRTKQLNIRKRTLESQIIEYLKDKDAPGFTFENGACQVESREIHKRKGEKEKIKDMEQILIDSGIDEPENIVNKILMAMKGEKEAGYKLRFERERKRKEN